MIRLRNRLCCLCYSSLMLAAVLEQCMAATATVAPSRRLDQSQLTLIALDVTVVGDQGKLVSAGELTCFGRDLGFCYPDPGRGSSLKDGRRQIHLPADTYTVIANGPGYCLVRDIDLRKPTSLVLRPEASIGIRTLDANGRDLAGVMITATSSRHTPYLRLFPCGITDKGQSALLVSRGSTLEIVAQKNPPVGQTDGTAYCYYAPRVTAGARVVLGGDMRGLAQIRWELLKARQEHCPRTSFDIEIPTLSLAHRRIGERGGSLREVTMAQQPTSSPLGADLRDRVLTRLGLPTPLAPDLEGLRSLYARWCNQVPFDNIRKMIALRTAADGLLPGGRATDFFDAWLADGAGGTCWPSRNALFELVRSVGFQAQRVVGCMRDLGLITHASVRVRLDGRNWLIDSSLLHEVPLPLDQDVFVSADPVFAAEVEPLDGGEYRVWIDVPPNQAYLPCRILAREETEDFYLSNYESSRDRSPFNQRLYARRNRPGELLVLVGCTRFSKTVNGIVRRDLSPGELKHALQEQIGLSERLVNAWIDAGGLAASFEPPSGPKPPPITGLPPSQRGCGSGSPA